MLALFLDESGDHNLSKIDPQYPIFVLGGCIFDMHYHQNVVTPRLNQVKLDLFGKTDLILHTADIARNKGEFERMKDQDFRQRFYDAINSLMAELDYTVIACVIKKEEHSKVWRCCPRSLYALAGHSD